MEKAEIVRKYLEIILNWPFLGAALIFWFLHAFKKEVRALLDRVKKIGNTEFEKNGQAEIAEKSLKLETPTKDNHNWEFDFYEYVVADSTAKSLLWLYSCGSSTKAHLFQNMKYPFNTPDVVAEKEAQFSTMLNYKFIEQNGELFKVSSKGVELLKYRKII